METMHYDIIIVGAGPAGLSAGIRFMQLAKTQQKTLRVCILEKGAQVGAHLISGAVIDPCSLQMLLPDTWQQAPLDTPVSEDQFLFLSDQRAFRLPTPKPLKNQGNYIISIGRLCQFLAQEAEKLGCEIYPGFAATKLLYNDQNTLIGVATGDMGVNKTGHPTEQFQAGMQLFADYTLFAEGCRGQLSEQLMKQFYLRKNCQPQTYGLGIKEIWRIQPAQHKLGRVVHTIGWPLDRHTYGGSFIYHLSDQRIAIGLIVGLDYCNPYLSPFEEMQKLKTHPAIRPLFSNAERLSYGARAINEGGYQSIPQLIFSGGGLIGDAAGFVNVPRIKGIHTAMRSGMLTAEAFYNQTKLDITPLTQELHKVRNIRPGFKKGLFWGLGNAAFETYITHGKSPWTLSHNLDYASLKPSDKVEPINYPKPDGIVTFDRLSSVYLTNTFHAENQPCHLKLRNPELMITVNYTVYASPETRYCPAAVYEINPTLDGPKFQINAQNCIHCKTCDIKDPEQNIIWTSPEGGGGPNYNGM